MCSLSVCCLSGLHDTPQAERRPHARRSPPQVAKPGYFHKMDLSRRFNHAFNYRNYGNQKKSRVNVVHVHVKYIHSKNSDAAWQGGAQTLKPGQGARTQGYKQTCTEQRSTAWESKTACGIYIWPSRATVTGSPVLGVDGHHAQPRRTRAVRVSPCS